MKKILLLGVLVLAVLVTGMWWLLPTGSGTSAPSASVAAVGNQPAPSATNKGVVKSNNGSSAGDFAHFAALGKTLTSLPRSLQGTQVDGHVAADASGNLILATGIREMFDYYLSALGEENLDAVKGRIAFYLQQHLPGSAAQQAWDLLGRYLEYRNSMSNVPAQATDAPVASLQQALAQRHDLREEWLGDAASQAFFGPEEAYDSYTLSRMQIEQNSALSDAEKQQQIEQLKANLPPSVAQMIQQTMAPTDVANKVNVMRQQGASEADIQAYRESVLGEAAAQRFATLDSDRAAWQSRYDDYRQQRQAIVNANLSASDQTQEITSLRERMFSGDEQKRVAALDDIAASKTTPTPIKTQP